MAVKDYKQMVVHIVDRGAVIATCDGIVEGILKYAKLAKSGYSVSLHVVVELKRRQSLDSYKMQVIKAILAHKTEINATLTKSKKILRDDYMTLIEKRLSIENLVPTCIKCLYTSKESASFTVISDRDCLLKG